MSKHVPSIEELRALAPEEVAALLEEAAIQALVAGLGRLSPAFWIPTLLLAGLVWGWRRTRLPPATRARGFWRWFFDRRIWLHPSSGTDLKLFLADRLVALTGVFNAVALASLVAVAIAAALSGPEAPATRWSGIWVGLILFAASDFSTYWVHRVFHVTARLWPFHAVHHSAEVLTPVTVARKHPLYTLISSLARGLFTGLIQGLLLAFFVGGVEPATVLGLNGFYFLFNLAGANLRHSHVWLAFPGWLEHILISPAQHQIHHSVDPRHYNSNYGEALAIWDWMFGSLILSAGQEGIRFGLTEKPGGPVVQKHPTLGAALLVPFREALAPHRRPARPWPETDNADGANGQDRGEGWRAS